MYILVVAATEDEINITTNWLNEIDTDTGPNEISVLVTGVGGTATAHALTRQIMTRTPELVINAGIGGSFSENYPPGSLVFVQEEVFADLGAFNGTDFDDVFDLGLAAVNQHPFEHRLLVNGHRDVLDDGWSRRDDALASYLLGAERRGDLELHVHDYLSDDDLWDYLARLDVSVLPYRFGTHSGWLEACRDLGTTVVVPDCGYFADQGPVLSYAMGEDRFDAESLRTALRTARTDPPPPADLAARARQRDEVAAAHLELYRRLLA